MQEAASKHADELGVSIRQLQSENYTWLLSRLKIKIASYPGWNDRMQVDTWPSGTRRLFALRDFELHDDHHQSIAAAISAWLVIDIRKRRPVQIAPFVERLKPLSRNHILPDPLDKLPGLEQTSFERSFHVRHRDLDINQHVNNVSFVEWVVESVPVSTLDASVLSELEINFLAEAFQKDRIRAACHPQNAANTVFHHGIVREQDGQELIRAKTVWRRF
jgi:acyl-ACP thioesterase